MSWLKLWDETVFGVPCQLRDTSNIVKEQSGKDFKKTRGRGERGGGRGGGGGGRGGPKPWEIHDPKTFASSDVSGCGKWVWLVINILLGVG